MSTMHPCFLEQETMDDAPVHLYMKVIFPPLIHSSQRVTLRSHVHLTFEITTSLLAFHVRLNSHNVTVRSCAGLPAEHVPPAQERGQRAPFPWRSQRGLPQKVRNSKHDHRARPSTLCKRQLSFRCSVRRWCCTSSLEQCT